MKTRIVLVVIVAGAFPSASFAQDCRAMPPGPNKAACLQSNPLFSAKLERCKQEATQMGLHAGIKGGLKESVQGCMQRGRR
jgi:hypothetical protein